MILKALTKVVVCFIFLFYTYRVVFILFLCTYRGYGMFLFLFVLLKVINLFQIKELTKRTLVLFSFIYYHYTNLTNQICLAKIDMGN